MAEKTCTRCRIMKHLDHFGNDLRNIDGKKSRCKLCEREVRSDYYKKHKIKIDKQVNEYRKANPSKTKSTLLKHWYGITIEEYNELLDKQQGKCAICKTDKPARFGRISKSFHVDHDHKTDKIRGLLCSKCNQGLGYFNDDPDLLERAIKYLRLKDV